MDETPSSFQYVTPPAAPDSIEPEGPPRILGIPRFVAGIVAGVVLLVAAGGAAVTVFFLAAGHGTVLDRMVPAGVGAYASVNLDPPADQKLDLLRLSQKLPQTSTQADIDKNLNQAVDQLGLSYTGDVKPWLGAQIVGLADASSAPSGAVLFDSKDDAAAQRTLSKFKAGKVGAQVSWSQSTHGGVTLQVGKASGQTIVLAYFDHTLLIASSESFADQIIDTDQGKHSRLDATAEYKRISGRLPSSRLVTVYVDGHGVSNWMAGILQKVSGSPGSLPVVSPFPVDPNQVKSTFAAFRGFGFALAARPDGLAADFETDVDQSKLTPDQRAMYARSSGANTAFRHIPTGAVAVFGLTDLDLISKQLSQPATTPTVIPPQVAQIASKLTGDGAVEVEPDGRTLAVGAVVGTADARGVEATLRQLAGSTGSAVPLFFGSNGEDLLVATSPGELARLQSASGGFQKTDTYRQAESYAVANPTSELYVDVNAAFAAAADLGLSSNADFDKARSDWSAVHSVLMTAGTTSARVHVVIT